MRRSGGRKNRDRKLARLKIEYLQENLPYTGEDNPAYDLTQWVKEIEDFAKQTVASQSDSGITEEQALRVIKSFILIANNATRMGNVPLFVKDSIELVEKMERAKEHKALFELQSKGGIEIPKFDPPCPMERTQDRGQKPKSVGSFVERRAAEPVKTQFYHPYAQKPKCNATNSSQRPETIGKLQRSFDQFIEQQRATELVNKCNENKCKSKEPSPLARLEAPQQAESSEPSLQKDAPEATRQTRASVIVTATMNASTPPTNPHFVPLIPKLEKT